MPSPLRSIPDPAEQQRLDALDRHQILDTLPEGDFDDLVLLAAQVCSMPIALVTLVAADRQWFKARIGLAVDETPRDIAFCAHAITTPDQLFVVEDASRDPRFVDNPLVTADPNIRFYAGAPIVDRDGHALGTVCVIDTQSRTFDATQRRCLAALARQASGLLELRRQAIDARHTADDLSLRNRTLTVDVGRRTQEVDRLWSQSEDLLAEVDADRRWVRVSASWNKVFGLDADALLSTPAIDSVHPDEQATVDAALTSALAQAMPVAFECRMRAADGSWRWTSWTWSREPGADRIHGVGRDTTHARERAAVLEAAQAALRQSQKMEALGQLTGGLAHDFNNLLTGITGSLELLQIRVAEGRIRELDRYLIAAQGAAKRAAALTHRLLAFARRQTLDPRPTDTNRLIADMEEMVRRTVGPHIVLDVVGGSALWPAMVDPNQLENALLNLCINARDAMPEGGHLTIETANLLLDAEAAPVLDLPPGPYLRVSVRDTGTGMSDEVVERAFDPFFTTKPLGAGTGLGLSMVDGFARQSGGLVRIESALGRGTTMSLYLPARVGKLEEALEAARTPPITGGGHDETVLIIDDEPTVRLLIAEVLDDMGYQSIEAHDGSTGLKVLQSQTPIDLLITDVGLPGGLNGRQVADAARSLKPALKVLFITGYAEHAVVGGDALESGMAVLTKPFSLDALSRQVRAMLARDET